MTQKPSRDVALAAVQTLLAYLGEDTCRQGLQGTPNRFLKAWETDWGLGYEAPAPDLTCFDGDVLPAKCEGLLIPHPMILVRDIRFSSHCEHHIAPFFGTADIAYIPYDKVVGLSKLARVTHHFARRLQVQERLTNQIAAFLMDNLQPAGVGVRLTGLHTCMMTRGVMEPESTTVTTALRGVFYENGPRAEFLQGCNAPRRV